MICETCKLDPVTAILKERGSEIEVLACPRCGVVLQRIGPAK